MRGGWLEVKGSVGDLAASANVGLLDRKCDNDGKTVYYKMTGKGRTVLVESVAKSRGPISTKQAVTEPKPMGA